MANDFYTASGSPATGSQGSSATMRAEFTSIEDGFDKLPVMTGNGGEIVAVNSGGTALEAITTTGTGSAVKATSPTLVTPVLGVATATSINGTTIPSSKTLVVTTDKLSVMAATSSSELASVISDETGSGALVFANTPTLVTPNIGVATATSVNGTSIPSSKTLVVTTDNLSALAATTSAELAGVISDETGTGSLVFSNTPTFVTPILGTPQSGTLTNCTGLPVSTGVTGFGTNVSTALAVSVGSSGAFVVNGGALGTPSSGTVTNLTGTASININGTVGATTPTTGAFTTLSSTEGANFATSSGNVGIGTTLPGETLDVRGSAVFNEDGADKDFRIEGDTNVNLFFSDASTDRIGIGTNTPAQRLDVSGNIKFSGALYENVYTITDGAAFEIDPSNGTVQLITLGASRTPKATSFAAGQSVTLMVLDGTAYTLTWTDATFGGSGVVWVGGTAPTLDTTKYTVIEFWKVSTQVYGALVGYA